MKQEVYIRTDDEGKVVAGRQVLIKAIRAHKNTNLSVTIEPKKSKRTSPQNALWWVYMDVIAREFGYTKDEMHEICKYKFLLSEKVDEKTGLVLKYIRSTTELNKEEFSELIENLYAWAATDFNILLPEPI